MKKLCMVIGALALLSQAHAGYYDNDPILEVENLTDKKITVSATVKGFDRSGLPGDPQRAFFLHVNPGKKETYVRGKLGEEFESGVTLTEVCRLAVRIPDDNQRFLPPQGEEFYVGDKLTVTNESLQKWIRN